MNGSTERKPEKDTFFLPILGPQRLEVPMFILRLVFVLNHVGFLAASPAITIPNSHRVLVHVVASFGLLRFQNPSVAALATNRFGRDIPGTNDFDNILFVHFQKRTGLEGTQEISGISSAVNFCKSKDLCQISPNSGLPMPFSFIFATCL